MTAQSSAGRSVRPLAQPQRSIGKILAVVVLLGTVVVGLAWWLNRPVPAYHAEDPGIYPFIGADSTGVDKMGFIDVQGNLVIQPQWDIIDPDNICGQLLYCNEGLCRVHKDGKFGYINYKGTEVIPVQFDRARLFVSGMAAVSVGGQWGFIDKSGHFLIKPEFDDAGDFLGSVAAVQQAGKWGFVDKSGKFEEQPIFESLSKNGFVGGLAAARLSGKTGYIDSHGKFAIAPKFEDAEDFSDGLAQVRLGHKWGYVNDTGKFVINPQFDQASSFIGGKAFVSVSGGQGTIGKDGRYVINPGQYSLNPIAGAAGLLEVKSDSGIGLVTRDGATVVPPSKEISRVLISFGPVYYANIHNKPVPITTSGRVLAGWYKGDLLSGLDQDMQNERSAVNSLQTLAAAEASYSASHPATGFISQLAALGPTTNPADQAHTGFIDAGLAAGVKNGYQFTLRIPDGASNSGVNSNYMLLAQPVTGHAGPTLCADSSRTLHYAAANQPCTTASPNY
jgi:hypothetical protein